MGNIEQLMLSPGLVGPGQLTRYLENACHVVYLVPNKNIALGSCHTRGHIPLDELVIEYKWYKREQVVHIKVQGVLRGVHKSVRPGHGEQTCSITS